MRFKLSRPLSEEDYDSDRRRTITKFLWFPTKINYELRWLEKALIEQRVTYKLVSDPDQKYTKFKLPFVRHYYWENAKWVDVPPNLT